MPRHVSADEVQEWMILLRLYYLVINSLSQWPTFKLLGIPYLVGKITFELLFQGPLAE